MFRGFVGLSHMGGQLCVTDHDDGIQHSQDLERVLGFVGLSHMVGQLCVIDQGHTSGHTFGSGQSVVRRSHKG